MKCLKFDGIAELLSVFSGAGLIDTGGGVWIDESATIGTFYSIDDCGSGNRYDSSNVQLAGAWCCFYPSGDDELPTALASYIHENTNNCCGLA